MTDRPVIVVGGGGHAKVVIDALRAAGIEVLGFTDLDADIAIARSLSKALGNDTVIRRYPAGSIRLALGIGGTGVDEGRSALYAAFKNEGYDFVTVVHPAATIAADVCLGEGCQVMAGAVVQTGSAIGTGAIVNTCASIDHDCTIGSFVHIAPGVTLSGTVTVGARSHIGVGATIIQGIHLPEATMVRAGSVVTRYDPASTTRTSDLT
jgi:sugar O-acyltransferase (sialic acid O-acetyltransferase NeuD family)